MATGSALARALPVAVDLPAALEHEVTAYLEREIGWQRVPLGGPLRPALLLAEQVRQGTPTVVVTTAAADALVLRRVIEQGGIDLLVWPNERARLADCAARLPRPAAGVMPAQLRVAGVAGGAGTSTLLLALAALMVWAGRRVVAVGGPGLLRLAGCSPWQGPAAAELSRLHPADAAREFGSVARRASLPGLWLLSGSATELQPAGWPVDVVLADQGQWDLHQWDQGQAERGQGEQGYADIVVARADASVELLVGSTLPVAVFAAGPRSPAQVRRVLGKKPEAWIAASAQVARAGLAGRVPTGLPASYFTAVRPLLGGGR